MACCQREVRWQNILRHLSLHVLLIAYTIIGGLVFQAIEQPREHAENLMKLHLAIETRENFTNTLFDNPSIVLNKTDLRKALLAYENALGQKLVTLTSVESFTEKWTLWNAIFYAGTLYTTIGYGNLYCKTAVGQTVTIFYCIVGIPLLLCVLNDLTKLLYKYALVLYFRFHYSSFKALFSKRIPASFNVAIGSSRHTLSTDTMCLQPEKNIPIYVALTVLIAYLLLGSIVFYFLEDWGYWTALYFFFISLSTIGLGDVVPEALKDTILAWILIIIGIALVSLCFSIMHQQLYEFYFRLTCGVHLDDSQRSIAADDDDTDIEYPNINGSFETGKEITRKIQKLDMPQLILPLPYRSHSITTLGIFQFGRNISARKPSAFSASARIRSISSVIKYATVATQTEHTLPPPMLGHASRVGLEQTNESNRERATDKNDTTLESEADTGESESHHMLLTRQSET